jgi:L-fuculose-phosphate aldolase
MPNPVESHQIQAIVEVCHRLYDRGMVTATDGNVSIRLNDGNILATRSGINKGNVTASDLIEVSPSGTSPGTARPSTEIGLHLFIYTQRPDVMAVVHAHPTVATAFSVAQIPLDQPILPEVIVGLGAIPLAQYATPSTLEVAASLRPFVNICEAVLLANHGVVTYGTDVWDAYFKMEKVEHAAQITFLARMLGGEQALTPQQLERLQAVSVQSYGKDIGRRLRDLGII